MAQQHGLVWGVFDFASKIPAAAGYLAQACADGTDFGNPEAEYESIQSLLRDGVLAVRGKRKNRTIKIRIRFSAPSAVAGPALEAAEKALMLQVGLDQPPPLVRTPPATGATASYYDVVIAEDPEWDSGNDNDLEEVLREYRYYSLTLQCLPFARAKNTVVVPAVTPPPPTPTTVNIDTCDSTTGWSKAASGFGPITKTNLVTNPSFETNATGWAAGAGVTGLARVASGLVGTYALQATGLGASDRIYVNGPTVPVTAGVTYASWLALRPDTAFGGPGSPTGGVLIRFYNSGNSQIGADLVVPQGLTTGSWLAFAPNATAPAGATTMQIFPYFDRPGIMMSTQEYRFSIDGVYITALPDGFPAYFDGSQSPPSGWSFAWTGTAHASTSTATSTTPATALSSTSGHVDLNGQSSPLYSPTRTLTLTRTGAVSMSTSPYLRVSAAITATGGAATLGFKIGAGSTPVSVTPIAVTPSTIAGYDDYYFATGSFDRLVLEASAAGGGTNTPTVNISVAHVARTDTITGLGTNRQITRTAVVGGSAPTQAAIRLFDATPAALGTEVLVHTSRNTNWSPALRPYRTTAGTTDATRVSGVRYTLGTASVYRIPANKFTDGTYALMALMSITASGTLTWSARIVSAAGAATVGSSQVVSGSLTVPVTTGYQVLNLAALSLPILKPEADQMVELTLTGTANMTIDEAWLFGLTDGSLTWIRDTDSLTWIEIRSPELGAPLPSIYGGTGAKGANSINVSWKAAGLVNGISYGSFGSHRAEPGLMQIFTVCTSSQAAQSEIEYYERYHSHVAGSAA